MVWSQDSSVEGFKGVPYMDLCGRIYLRLRYVHFKREQSHDCSYRQKCINIPWESPSLSIVKGILSVYSVNAYIVTEQKSKHKSGIGKSAIKLLLRTLGRCKKEGQRKEKRKKQGEKRQKRR